MGAALAKAADTAHWARRLSPLARVLLSHMCLQALDKDSPRGQLARRYFAGRDQLILTVTGDVPEWGTTEYENADRRVKKYLTELRRNGAITTVRMAAGGNRAEYEVHPDRLQDTLPEADQ